MKTNTSQKKEKRKALGHLTNGCSPEREIHEIHCMA